MKKKVLFIIWSFSLGGGAENILKNIVNNLDKNKYDIDILEYRNYGVKREQVNDNINVLKPIIDDRKDSRLKKYIIDKLVFHFPMLLRKFYVKKHYDIEISFNYEIPSFLLSRNKNVKKFSWVHGNISNLKDNAFKMKKQRKAFDNADNIVAICDDTYNSIINLYPEFKEKIKIIYNGYDFDNIISKSKESANDLCKKKNLLFLGRLDQNKNPMRVLEIAKLSKEKKIDVCFDIVGTGILKDDLEKFIVENNLNNIRLLGYKQNPYPYIKNCLAIISTSKSEGFPTVFVEGMCLGKPFVSPLIGGATKLSNNSNNGIICNTNDDFIEAIEYMIYNDDKYMQMSKNCVNSVKEFTLEKQIENLEKLFKGDN